MIVVIIMLLAVIFVLLTILAVSRAEYNSMVKELSMTWLENAQNKLRVEFLQQTVDNLKEERKS